MFQYVFLIFFFIVSSLSLAQDFDWVKSAGDKDEEYALGIGADREGNIYVAGFFDANGIFHDSLAPRCFDHDMFLIKYNSSGEVQWIRRAGGTGEEKGYGLAVDSIGNCYVTGTFDDQAVFGTDTLNSKGSGDIYVAKYNWAGELLWVKTAGGISLDYAYGIAVSGSDLYVTGGFRDTAYFENSTVSSTGNIDVFISKYDTSGILKWVTSAGGTGYDVTYGISASDQQVFITGLFYNSASFNTSTLTSNGNSDMFVAAYDTSGALTWVKGAGGLYADAGNTIKVTPSGDIYISGKFQDTVLFDNVTVTAKGSSDIFLAKYDRAGNLIWLKTAGGAYPDECTFLCTDSTGNIYITGYHGANAFFDTVTTYGAGMEDVFIASYDSAGKLRFIKTAGGGAPDAGYGIVVCQEEKVYLIGSFSDTAFFDSHQVTSRGLNDFFLAQLIPEKETIIRPGPGEGDIDVKLYPNPASETVNILLPEKTKKFLIKVFNQEGKIIHQKITGMHRAQVDVSAFPRGIYFIEVSANSYILTKRLILK